MGILNLLPNLKGITKERHISAYAGQRVAIDMYVWIHKALYTCAIELYTMNDYQPLLAVIEKRIEVFHKLKVELVFVFDGDQLPTKLATEKTREANRKKNIEEAKKNLENGNRYAANNFFARGIDVTPEMAHAVIQLARKKNIECIVAPYEADAQLAYLSKIGYVDSVVTEDSDLLAFGAEKVLFKLNNEYFGEEICLKNLQQNTTVSFEGWTHDMFLTCCILAGCDYLENLKNVGFKKAQGLMSSIKSPKMVLNLLTTDKRYSAMPDFEAKFQRAYLSFKFQRVFCPIKKELVTLSGWDIEKMREGFKSKEDFLSKNSDFPMDDFDEELIKALWTVKSIDFVGENLPKDVACGVAYGYMEPTTKNFFKGETHVKIPTFTAPIKCKNGKADRPDKKDSEDFREKETKFLQGKDFKDAPKKTMGSKKQVPISNFVLMPTHTKKKNQETQALTFNENSENINTNPTGHFTTNFSPQKTENQLKCSDLSSQKSEDLLNRAYSQIYESPGGSSGSGSNNPSENNRKHSKLSRAPSSFTERFTFQKINVPKNPKQPIVPYFEEPPEENFFSRSSTKDSETTILKILPCPPKVFKKIKKNTGSLGSILSSQRARNIEIAQDEVEPQLGSKGKETHFSEMLKDLAYKPAKLK